MSDVNNETLAALTDIFGNRTYAIQTQYFTPIEKNTLSPEFKGLILWNRIIWILFAIVILLVSYLNFSFKEKNKKVKAAKNQMASKTAIFTLPELHFQYDRKTNWLQFKSFFFVNFLSIVKSVTFLILFIFSAIILIANLLGGFEYFGLQSYPLTYKLIDLINNA